MSAPAVVAQLLIFALCGQLMSWGVNQLAVFYGPSLMEPVQCWVTHGSPIDLRPKVCQASRQFLLSHKGHTGQFCLEHWLRPLVGKPVRECSLIRKGPCHLSFVCLFIWLFLERGGNEGERKRRDLSVSSFFMFCWIFLHSKLHRLRTSGDTGLMSLGNRKHSQSGVAQDPAHSLFAGEQSKRAARAAGKAEGSAWRTRGGESALLWDSGPCLICLVTTGCPVALETNGYIIFFLMDLGWKVFLEDSEYNS